jgi:hypothetical protein
MYQRELIYFIVLATVVLFSQFLPMDILLLLDSIVIRIIIVLLILYLISIGPTAGIFGLMAIASLYLERNRRKVIVASKKIDLLDVNRPQQATVKEASQPQKTVPVNEFDEPNNKESDYIPSNTCDTDNFEPVDSTINEKAVLSTSYPLAESNNESASAIGKLYENLGFGHVKGLATLGNE